MLALECLLEIQILCVFIQSIEYVVNVVLKVITIILLFKDIVLYEARCQRCLFADYVISVS